MFNHNALKCYGFNGLHEDSGHEQSYEPITSASSAIRTYMPYFICNIVSYEWSRESYDLSYLAEIGTSRIVIDLFTKLHVSWKRMHDNHILLCGS